MIRCARFLEIMRDEQLVEAAATKGVVFKQRLEELQAEFPAVTNVRGRGFLLAFDLPDTGARDRIRRRCWDEGFATLTCGTRSIRFRPALVFGEEEIEKGLAILRKVLAE
jgi:L-lysine 6-transaminase